MVVNLQPFVSERDIQHLQVFTLLCLSITLVNLLYAKKWMTNTFNVTDVMLGIEVIVAANLEIF